jgi:hypothetical protein
VRLGDRDVQIQDLCDRSARVVVGVVVRTGRFGWILVERLVLQRARHVERPVVRDGPILGAGDRHSRLCGVDGLRSPVGSWSGDEAEIGLRAAERGPGTGGVEVVVWVLHLERVVKGCWIALALCVVGHEQISAVDGTASVDVEVPAHPQGDPFDVQGGDALIEFGRV